MCLRKYRLVSFGKGIFCEIREGLDISEGLEREKNGLLRVRDLLGKYQLTKKQCEALLLRCEGLRYREIGKEMGITFQSAWELVQAAVKKVRKKVRG